MVGPFVLIAPRAGTRRPKTGGETRKRRRSSVVPRGVYDLLSEAQPRLRLMAIVVELRSMSVHRNAAISPRRKPERARCNAAA